MRPGPLGPVLATVRHPGWWRAEGGRVGWGIGVAANAWDAYGRKPVTEDRLQREIRRLQR